MGVQHLEQDRRRGGLSHQRHGKHAQGIGQLGVSGGSGDAGQAPRLDARIPYFLPPGLGNGAGFQVQRAVAGDHRRPHAAGGPVHQGEGFIFEGLDDLFQLQAFPRGADPAVDTAAPAALPMHQLLIGHHRAFRAMPVLAVLALGQQEHVGGALLIQVGRQPAQQPPGGRVGPQPGHVQQQGVVGPLADEGGRSGR